MSLIKIPILALLAGGILLLPVAPVEAASCAAKANSAAASNQGQVLSVSVINSGGVKKCKITLLVKSKNGGPARKKTITVPK